MIRNIHLQRCRDRQSLSDTEVGWTEMVHLITLQWGLPLGERLSAEEAETLWQRFKPVDDIVQRKAG